jgi:hypothetical protein
MGVSLGPVKQREKPRGGKEGLSDLGRGKMMEKPPFLHPNLFRRFWKMRKSFITMLTVGACLLTAIAFAELPQIAKDRVSKRADHSSTTGAHQQAQASGACGPQPCAYFEDFEGADFVVGSNILGQGAAGGIFETWNTGCGGSLTGNIVDNTNAFSGTKHLRLRKDGALTTTPFGCVVAARVPGNAVAEANTPVVGPTTVSHMVSISGVGGSDFNTQPQARWQGFSSARVLYFYYGSLYSLDILPGMGLTFAFMGNWDSTGAYQKLDIVFDPCNPFHCNGGVDDGLACTTDADCVGDGGAIPDGACAGRIHYDYGNGAVMYDGIIYGGINVDQFLVYSDNFGQTMDVDDVSITRGDPCPTTCGADGIEPGEDCETDDDSPCPGKCVGIGQVGPNGEQPCECIIQNATCETAYPLENDVEFVKTAHGGWFTFTASANAYAVDTCGVPNYDSALVVFTGTCDSLVAIAQNDDCYDGTPFGAGSDPLAPCYDQPGAATAPYNACLCVSTTLNQQYWVLDPRINGTPVGSTIDIVLSKRQSCDALWGDFGACCRGLTGACEDNVAEASCNGAFDTYYERKDCGADIITCTAVTGACCTDAVNGTCASGVTQAQCPAPGVWTPNGSCTATCAPHLGACCNTDTGVCTDGVLAVDCADAGETWTDGSSCSAIVCESAAIPTVSEWGLVIMTLLLLAGAKVYFGRRREVLA